MSKGIPEDGLVYHAGFPNAGEEQATGSLSLDNLVVKHRLSTFFWRLETGIEELHWPAGTLVVVDRALSPSVNRLVVAVDESGFRLARYKKSYIEAPNGEVLSPESTIWGVVTHCVQAV